MKMYFAVSLLNKTKLCIPIFWMQNINIVECFNNVFKRYEKRLVFYSKYERAEPNFSLPIISDFDENIDACYYGHVLKAFESKEKCMEYLNKRRAGAPPVYYPEQNATGDDNVLRSEISRQMAMDSKIQIKKEVETLREAVLNSRTAQSIDLTESDTEDYQNGIDEPTTIEDELEVLQEAIPTRQTKNDCLSGNMFFTEEVVRMNFIFVLMQIPFGRESISSHLIFGNIFCRLGGNSEKAVFHGVFFFHRMENDTIRHTTFLFAQWPFRYCRCTTNARFIKTKFMTQSSSIFWHWKYYSRNLSYAMRFKTIELILPSNCLKYEWKTNLGLSNDLNDSTH